MKILLEDENTGSVTKNDAGFTFAVAVKKSEEMGIDAANYVGQISKVLLGKIHTAQQLIKDNGLYEVIISEPVGEIYNNDGEIDPTDFNHIVISQGSFFFRLALKHDCSGQYLETENFVLNDEEPNVLFVVEMPIQGKPKVYAVEGGDAEFIQLAMSQKHDYCMEHFKEDIMQKGVIDFFDAVVAMFHDLDWGKIYTFAEAKKFLSQSFVGIGHECFKNPLQDVFTLYADLDL